MAANADPKVTVTLPLSRWNAVLKALWASPMAMQYIVNEATETIQAIVNEEHRWRS